MIGIVLVSHSPALAQATLDLALQMVPGDRPRVAVAAGAAGGVLGTDAMRVSEAIADVASPDGVLVFMDLGSAVLSAEMALELVPSVELRVLLTAAPFVEGLVAGLVRAAAGAGLEEVEREARGAMSAKSSQLGGDHEHGAGAETAALPEIREPERVACVTVTDPEGLHARPAALLVAALGAIDARVGIQNLRTRAVATDASSMTSLLTLGARQGDQLRVSASGPDADRAVSEICALFAAGSAVGPGERPDSGAASDTGALPTPLAEEAAAPGETAPATASLANPAPGTAPASRTAPFSAAPFSAGPIGVSPGRAVALVARMAEPAEEPAAALSLPENARNREADRIDPAAAAVRRALTARAEGAGAGGAAGNARAILEATALVAADPAVAQTARLRVLERGESAERAVWSALSSLADQLAAGGGRMAERAADLRDVRDRIVAELRGTAAPGVPEPDHPFILVARDLAPADTAVLDPRRCLGLITAEGGPTSHTAILARALGIPAIVAAPFALDIPDGARVLIDGSTAEIVVDPSDAAVAEAAARPSLAPFDGTGRTADGHRVELLANVGSPETVDEAVAASAEGVGLFRTEFCFLDRLTAPDRLEQAEAYERVLRGFPGRKVIVRTLDAGADKPLPFLTDAAEANPALGVRGYRTSWRRPEVLEEQLAAIAVARDALRGDAVADVWVMAPMIDTAAEARDFVGRCRAHGLMRAGVMIETPAAALTAAEILAEVDFVSLGTNDLAQYTMAADRLIGDLAALNDAWQPAVLRLVGMVGSAGAAAGKPVGVCGEAGADPALAPVLAGLGVTSLSMTPRAIRAVAGSLARVSREQCVEAAHRATAAIDAVQARRAVAELLSA